METTKLTVRVPRAALEAAKAYARAHNTTLTRLITEYLRRLAEPEDYLAQAPTVQRLTGSLSPEARPEEYLVHLEEKYGSSRPR